MPEIKLRKVMRCPVCFARENDVNLLLDGEEYYCIKCSYHGTAEEVAERYAELRKKYRWKLRRIGLEDLRKL